MLTGTLPSEMFSIHPNMMDLSMCGNQISGGFPASWETPPTSLYSMILCENNLSFPLGSGMKALADLETLDLSDNPLQGPLPSLATLDPTPNRIKHVRISDAFTGGSLPEDWDLVSPTLEFLELSGNNLSGVIPGVLPCAEQLAAR